MPLQYPKRLNSFDFSTTRPLIVLGGDDGGLVVHDLKDASEKVLVLKGCIGDITQTRFFPSGEVRTALSCLSSCVVLTHSPRTHAAPRRSSCRRP